MKHALILTLLFAAVFSLRAVAAAEEVHAARPSVAVETTGLAYGLAVNSPRVSASASIPMTGYLSLQGSATVAWGNDGSIEIVLPLVLRLPFKLGPFTPYAAAGLELGWGRLAGCADIAAIGPTGEIGERFSFSGRGFFIEPYAGGAVMFASYQGGAVSSSLFFGLRAGLEF